MRIGVIGAGAIGQAVARRATAGGHAVVLSNSRGPDSLADTVSELGAGATAGTVADAAAAELVVLAVPWKAVGEVLEGLPPWDGRILVDATNQFTRDGGFEVPDDDTGSEWVARQAPGARVVKGFNTLFARVLAADPRHAEGRQVVFLAGDDADAKATFAELVDGLGYAPVDTGTLHDGGRPMQIGGFLSGLHVLRQEV
jgi:8-hydroxy-5-deazaflavin:NADPH oxidoreductase